MVKLSVQYSSLGHENFGVVKDDVATTSHTPCTIDPQIQFCITTSDWSYLLILHLIG